MHAGGHLARTYRGKVLRTLSSLDSRIWGSGKDIANRIPHRIDTEAREGITLRRRLTASDPAVFGYRLYLKQFSRENSSRVLVNPPTIWGSLAGSVIVNNLHYVHRTTDKDRLSVPIGCGEGRRLAGSVYQGDS